MRISRRRKGCRKNSKQRNGRKLQHMSIAEKRRTLKEKREQQEFKGNKRSNNPPKDEMKAKVVEKKQKNILKAPARPK